MILNNLKTGPYTGLFFLAFVDSPFFFVNDNPT